MKVCVGIYGQCHERYCFVTLKEGRGLYRRIGPNLTKIFFKLSRPKGNLCGGGVTVLNPKYPRLSSGNTIPVLQ